MKKSQILGFFIIYVNLSILKISNKSETWSPEHVRFDMELTIYIFFLKQFVLFKNKYEKSFILMSLHLE